MKKAKTAGNSPIKITFGKKSVKSAAKKFKRN